jgi:hypothetical protein
LRRFVGIAAIVLSLLAAGLLAAMVGVVMPRTFRVVGPDGAPAEAWVAFVHEGNHVHYAASLDWRRPGGLLHSDASGIVQLPLVIYLKPPLEGWVRHKVQMIFAPSLHATQHEQLPADGEIIQVLDYTADPAAWDHALDEIYSLVANDMTSNRHRRYAVDSGTVRTFARLVVDDYRAFMATHGDRQREVSLDIPGHLQFASEEDRAEWLGQMRREAELEPTWGIYLERRYARRIADLENMFGL